MEENKNIEKRVDVLFEKVAELIILSRQKVASAANLAEVYTKFRIGQYIVEYEQQGNARAEYGKQVLKDLSARLTQRFGEGWSVETLKKCRYFYIVYSNKQIGSTVLTQLPEAENGQQRGPFSTIPSLKSDEGVSFTVSSPRGQTAIPDTKGSGTSVSVG